MQNINKNHKHIISLDGDRYLIYYNNGEIKDIDITPNEVPEDIRLQYVQLLQEAYDDTDPHINHTKTIEYIKNDYIARLDALYKPYFDKKILNFDGHKFNISSYFLHYLNTIQENIKNGQSQLQIINFNTQEITWYDTRLSFTVFLEYLDRVIVEIEKLNIEFATDKKWIANLSADVDFSGIKDIQDELLLLQNIENKIQDLAFKVFNELQLLFTDLSLDNFDIKKIWFFLNNLLYNPDNKETYDKIIPDKQNILLSFWNQYKQYCEEEQNVHHMIENEIPNYDKTQKQLNLILQKWSF